MRSSALPGISTTINRASRRIDINFYALRKDGEYAGATLWSHVVRNGKLVPKQFAVNDGGESRLENCAWLFERKRA